MASPHNHIVASPGELLQTLDLNCVWPGCFFFIFDHIQEGGCVIET